MFHCVKGFALTTLSIPPGRIRLGTGNRLAGIDHRYLISQAGLEVEAMEDETLALFVFVLLAPVSENIHTTSLRLIIELPHTF